MCCTFLHYDVNEPFKTSFPTPENMCIIFNVIDGSQVRNFEYIIYLETYDSKWYVHHHAKKRASHIYKKKMDKKIV